MPLVFVCPNRAMTAWVDAIRTVAPELDLRIWPHDGRGEEVVLAVTWKHPAGILRRYPNLKAVLSLGAGIDHFLTDDALPAGPAYGRIVDPQLVAGMSQYVAAAVLDAHRGFAGYRRHQAERRWQPEAYAPAAGWPVGLLGLGAMGMDAARVLLALGYPVLGWSASPKPDVPFETCTGEAGLDRMLPRCRALVCLLPLTDQTRGILNRTLFDRLPRGAYLINAARGGHLVDADLLAALDAGWLAGAWLDVFHDEPLPAAHPFWSHPAIAVTPHIASITNPVSAASQVVADYRSALAGQPLAFPVDLGRAY